MQVIKIGDIVRLKSGGPEMTVEGVGELDVAVVYFVDHELHRHSVAIADLA
jgi:hypothetical protein